MNINTHIGKVLTGFALVVCSFSAVALTLSPGDENYQSNKTSALNEVDVANFFGTSDLTLLYKKDYDDGIESGTYADFYSTYFSGEPNDALIEWDGPDYILCPECYLVVKDGKEPQYLFDLANWDGQDDLDLQNFYEGPGGAISHVAIFGKSIPVDVPEPGTLALFGLGLAGLIASRRKLQK